MANYPRPISDAISALVVKQPFFACLLFDLMEIRVDNTHPTAATDGKRILINEPWFAALSVPERVFVLSHEIAHVAFGHMVRAKQYLDSGFGPDLKPFSFPRWNKAADYIINDLLTVSGVGAMPQGGLRDSHIATHTDTADAVYPNIPEDDPNDNFDQHLKPAQNGPSSAAVASAVLGAANAAKAQGKLPSALSRAVDTLLNPQVPWAEQLRDFITETARGRDSTSWARPNRRKLALPPNIPMPGPSGYAMAHAVVAIDVSGSIGPAELTAFVSEVAGILDECRPQRLSVIWWDTDAMLQDIEDMDDLANATPVGGGGTNYDCVFDLLDEEQLTPDVMICLTDGYISCSHDGAPCAHVTVTTGKDLPFGKNIKLALHS